MIDPGALMLAYRRAGNWLLPLLRQRSELAHLPVARIGPCDVHFALGGSEYLAVFGVAPRRETLRQRAYRLALRLQPFGTSLTLQPDDTTGVDCYLQASTPDTARDTTLLYLRAWRSDPNGNTGLVLFNLSGLPSGAVVSAATLTLTKGGPTASTTGTCARVLAANAAWNEASTWNYCVPTSQRWAGDAGGDGGSDGGCNVSGTDYSATSMGSWPIASTDAVGTAYAISLNLTEFALMQAANYGLRLCAVSASVNSQVASSGHLTPEYRPKLEVTYTAATGNPPFGAPFQTAFRGAFG